VDATMVLGKQGCLVKPAEVRPSGSAIRSASADDYALSSWELRSSLGGAVDRKANSMSRLVGSRTSR